MIGSVTEAWSRNESSNGRSVTGVHESECNRKITKCNGALWKLLRE